MASGAALREFRASVREWCAAEVPRDLYQELLVCDAPRLVLAFVESHHAATTLFAADTAGQRDRAPPCDAPGDAPGQVTIA